MNGRSNIPGTFGLITVPYDAMAFSEKSRSQKIKKNSMNYISTLIRNYIKLYIIGSSKEDLIPVLSVFNGFAIYRTSALQNSTYKNNGNVVCEHNVLHKNMDKLFICHKLLSYQPRQGDGSVIKQVYNCFKLS